MPAESADSLAGQLVGGRYRLARVLGKGGMGVVYEAEHVGLDKRVAVKFLLERFNDDREVIERFHREARNASRIGHDHIIDVTDVGDGSDGRPYIVMEYLDGADLAEVFKRTGPMPAARAVRLIRQVLRGLEAAHAKGIVHRDMKPENVFLVRRGDDPDFVKVMDFGISKVIAANDSKVRLTQTGAVIGTPIYMAPEQALGQTELDHRVDLYAVGVMLYELLAGRPPFLAMNYLGLVTQHLNSAPPNLAGFRPDLPPQIVAAVHRALEKDPANRFQSAAEMARALPPDSALRELDGAVTLGDTDGARVVTAGVQAVRPATRAGEPTETPTRKRTGAWILAGAVLVAIGMVVVALATRGDKRRDARAPGPAAPVPVGREAVEPTPGPEVVSLGRLDVRTSPSGAKVYLDDEYSGESPVSLRQLPAGKYRLRLEKAGHQTLAMTVLVSADKTDVVDEVLQAIGGAVPAVSDGGKVGSGSAGSGKVSGGGKKVGSGSGSAKASVSKTPGTGTGTGTGSGSSGKKTGRPGQKPNPYD